MRPPLYLVAKLLAQELPDLTNERAALNLLASAGYPPKLVIPYLDQIIAIARKERAKTADAITTVEAQL
jgi:hypothetical protein